MRPYTGALGRPLGATAGNYRQHSLYVGWVTCLLALLGVVLWLGAWGLFFAASPWPTSPGSSASRAR